MAKTKTAPPMTVEHLYDDVYLITVDKGVDADGNPNIRRLRNRVKSLKKDLANCDDRLANGLPEQIDGATAMKVSVENRIAAIEAAFPGSTT